MNIEKEILELIKFINFFSSAIRKLKLVKPGSFLMREKLF